MTDKITIQGEGSEIALLARVVELERVIRMVEWIEGGMQFRCPWCKRTPIPGHAPDCPRQAALGKENAPSPP